MTVCSYDCVLSIIAIIILYVVACGDKLDTSPYVSAEYCVCIWRTSRSRSALGPSTSLDPISLYVLLCKLICTTSLPQNTVEQALVPVVEKRPEVFICDL